MEMYQHCSGLWGLLLRNRFTRSLLIALSCIVYCEVLHYAVVLVQCTWPSIPQPSQQGQLKVMFMADTHLLGFKRGHWFDKLRREWQMKQAFQTTMLIHQPDVVFVLGDLFDEGKWCPDDEFDFHVKRFKSMFAIPEDTEMHVVSGNHDEGFHYMITPHKHVRFEKNFQAPSVRQVRIKDNIFVLVNSMAMEGDHCSLCEAAEGQLEGVSQQLVHLQQCDKKTSDNIACESVKDVPYTRPILLQHFPMYRPSDAVCNTSDSAPPQEKKIHFRVRMDCLDQRSTDLLLSKLNPRLVVSGHTHHGCYVVHRDHIPEWSVASFSWRNRNDPTILLARISNTDYVVSQCFLPRESTVITLYCIFGILFVLSLLWPSARLQYRKKLC